MTQKDPASHASKPLVVVSQVALGLIALIGLYMETLGLFHDLEVQREELQTAYLRINDQNRDLERSNRHLATLLDLSRMMAAMHRLDLLTRRERDVLVGIASGKANKEIAGDLGLSVRTVESYRETLMAKLAIRTTAGLTRFAIESRLLGAEPPDHP